MDKQYWDALADDYKSQVLSVYANDKQGVLQKTFKQYIKPSHVVADFGCGIGGGLGLLSRYARKVYGVDLSDKLLACAQSQNKSLDNIDYIQCNLIKDKVPFKPVSVIVSVNVLISPKTQVREKILRAMKQSLKPNGILILVVPSLESQLWIYNRQLMIKQRKLKKLSSAKRTVNNEIARDIKSLSEGILNMPDTPTKCYLNHELDAMLTINGFNVLNKQEIPYPWREELMNIKNPNIALPWNWLVVAQKQ